MRRQNSPLLEPALYALFPGGKRLRPLITLLIADHLDIQTGEILDAACSLELIHTYSLIHDDLPCMDDDDFRRGKPSLHKAFPEGQAVLTGDLLLTLAFEILPSISLVQELARAVGGAGMIAGQSLDLSSEGKNLNWPGLEVIHKRKTADLFSAAFVFPALIKGIDPEPYHQMGQDFGLLFQIENDEKKSASDQANEKSTALGSLGNAERHILKAQLRSKLQHWNSGILSCALTA